MAKIINNVNMEPDSDDTRDIGSSSKRFSNVYGVNGIFDTVLRIPVAASDPGTPTQGDIYFNTTDSKIYVYDGASWVGVTLS